MGPLLSVLDDVIDIIRSKMQYIRLIKEIWYIFMVVLFHMP